MRNLCCEQISEFEPALARRARASGDRLRNLLIYKHRKQFGKTDHDGEKMKFHLCPELGFWIEVEVSREASRYPGLSKQRLLAKVLSEFEQAGDAMRYVRADGKIGWKPTQWMLDKLADAERDAREDAED
jgi:hypothetical protein